MKARGAGGPSGSPKRRARRLWVLAGVAVLGAVVGRGLVPRLSPWRHVQEVADVILVDTGCHFSEAAVACLAGARGEGASGHTVPVTTSDEGELHRSSCRAAMDAVSRRGSVLGQGLLWLLPQDLWCRTLSDQAGAWLIQANGQLEWPAFVRRGRLVGVGLEAENFRAVGEDDVAAKLDACVDAYLRDERARQAAARGTPSVDG